MVIDMPVNSDQCALARIIGLIQVQPAIFEQAVPLLLHVIAATAGRNVVDVDDAYTGGVIRMVMTGRERVIRLHGGGTYC